MSLGRRGSTKETAPPSALRAPFSRGRIRLGGVRKMTLGTMRSNHVPSPRGEKVPQADEGERQEEDWTLITLTRGTPRLR